MSGFIAAAVQAGKAPADVGMSFEPGTWWLVTIIVSAVIGILGFFGGMYLKRLARKQDEHDEAISLIQRTYVTKDDLKEVKQDFAKNTDKLQHDVEEIKDKCLTKRDYLERQAQTETRLDKIYDIIIGRGGQ